MSIIDINDHCFMSSLFRNSSWAISSIQIYVQAKLNERASGYSSIPGNRNWQIETADWNLDVRLDI